MYRLLGIANYEDRFVVPTSHEEIRHEDPYAFQGQNGFSPGNTSGQGGEGFTLFPAQRKKAVTSMGIVSTKKN
jgi:nitrate reductase beta subunit